MESRATHLPKKSRSRGEEGVGGGGRESGLSVRLLEGRKAS